jgi:hypothetical protein
MMSWITQPAAVPIDLIGSEADFILYSADQGLLSEHFTEGEARLAYYKEAASKALGQQLPVIYERQEPNWVPLT